MISKLKRNSRELVFKHNEMIIPLFRLYDENKNL